jgi:hypothetical protein
MKFLRLTPFVFAAAVASAQVPFQTSRAIITNNEIVGAASGSTPITTFEVVDTGTATPRGLSHSQYNNGANSAQLNTFKARGTRASPLTIVTGDILGRQIFWGHDGTNFIESANVRATSSGTIATSRIPSQLEFYTSTNAAPSVLTLGMTLTSSAHLLVGSLAVDGTGIIQFPAGTTNASGITFGTDAFVFRDQSGRVQVGTNLYVPGSAISQNGFATNSNGAANNTQFGNVTSGMYFPGGNTVAFSVGSTLALSFDTSQNASFAASATIAKRLITTPSSLTYAAPTSVDVTLGNVFTATTVNATGSVTFNATAGGTAGQRITFIITNDATSAKTITFGTNFVANGTLTPSGANKVVTIEFMSNGTNLYEVARTVLP